MTGGAYEMHMMFCWTGAFLEQERHWEVNLYGQVLGDDVVNGGVKCVE